MTRDGAVELPESSPPEPDAPGGALTTSYRLYLMRRRHELLAPILAIRDIVAALLAGGEFQARPLVNGDLETVQTSTEELIALVDHALEPAWANGGPPARSWHHDARNLLAIILGYSDELRRGAVEESAERDVTEFEQLVRLGKRALSLVDATVAQLNSPDSLAAIDEVQTYLDRGECDGEFSEDTDLTSTEPGLILVVEDHDKVRDLLCDLLRRQGHEVVPANDGQEALALLGSRAFELVLTDIEMPRVNGFQILENLKADESLRDIPVIVVSGQAELNSICRCIKTGAEDYLPKPYNPVILKARVDACLEKKRLRDRNEQQRRRYDELLHSILPAPIVAELTTTNTVRPRRRERVAVLFADIVGFTPYCNQRQSQPEVIVHYLRQVFEAWEEITEKRGVQKIKTIGDAFMAASGLLNEPANPVLDCVASGIDMIKSTRELLDVEGAEVGWDLRVGIHIGPVVAGVLGRRQSLLDLWGDTVNIAARLESHGIPGHVNLSTDAWAEISSCVRGETRTMRKLKGTEDQREVIHLGPDCLLFLQDAGTPDRPAGATPTAE